MEHTDVCQTEQPEMTEQMSEEFLSRHQLAEVAYRVKQVMIITKSFGYKGAHAKLISNDVICDATGVDTLAMLGVKAEIQAQYEAEHQVESKLQSSNVIDFIKECCDVSKEFSESSINLYKGFVSWNLITTGQGAIMGRRSFGLTMGKLFHKIKKGTIFYLGIRLREVKYE